LSPVDPFPSLRIDWPKTAKTSVKLEALDAETWDKILRLGLLAFLKDTTSKRNWSGDRQGRWNRVRLDHEPLVSRALQNGREPEFLRAARVVDEMWLREMGRLTRGFVPVSLASSVQGSRRCSVTPDDPIVRLRRRHRQKYRGAAWAPGRRKEPHGRPLRRGETRRQQMGQSLGGDAHVGYRRTPELTRKQCLELSRLPLIEGVDGAGHDGLDFEGMASKLRSMASVEGPDFPCSRQRPGRILSTRAVESDRAATAVSFLRHPHLRNFDAMHGKQRTDPFTLFSPPRGENKHAKIG
jgi:hypothetical protein